MDQQLKCIIVPNRKNCTTAAQHQTAACAPHLSYCIQIFVLHFPSMRLAFSFNHFSALLLPHSNTTHFTSIWSPAGLLPKSRSSGNLSFTKRHQITGQYLRIGPVGPGQGAHNVKGRKKKNTERFFS